MKVTKESIDKKLGFDWTDYPSKYDIEQEWDIIPPNPFDVLDDEELEFVTDDLIYLKTKDIQNMDCKKAHTLTNKKYDYAEGN